MDFSTLKQAVTTPTFTMTRLGLETHSRRLLTGLKRSDAILEIQSTSCHWRGKELCSEKPRVAEKLTLSSPQKEKEMQFPFRTSRNAGAERRDFFSTCRLTPETLQRGPWTVSKVGDTRRALGLLLRSAELPGCGRWSLMAPPT